MTTVPTYLLFAQWALLFVLAALIFIMYRQLAQLLQVRPRDHQHGLAVGARAPRFDYRDARRPEQQGSFTPEGEPTLLVFADPSCNACVDAMARIDMALELAGPDPVRVLVATAEPASFVERTPAFAGARAPVVLIERETVGSYRVDGTPHFYLVGADGAIAESGPAWSSEQIQHALDRRSAHVGQIKS
ncbi:TlpA family protein disulfide reductase [Allonocardiopsis opalescens]|uniref:Thioredoxin domain-containing protein n=1 Tax=Allonocardiopsis opalescens TaxID=1144618 RepID=A0A2T0Q2P5_9ACTN|nr:hypothetical protein [Allonocardiopsis opalescens]PRX98064.1 hypothetical protein CLV72_105417 [Allonocardiopsis opalescens]